MAAACWPAQGQGVKDRQMTVKPVATEVRPMQPEMTRRFAALHPRLQPSARTWVEQQARLEAQKPTPDIAALESAIRTRFAANTRSTTNPGSTANPRATVNPRATANPSTANPRTTANPGSTANLGAGALPAGADIEAVAFLVMMQATQDMDKDLQAIMAEVKAMTNAKQKLRDLINLVNKDVADHGGKPDAPCLPPGCASLASELKGLSASTAGLQRPVRLSAPARPTYANLRALQGQLKQNLDSMSEMSETESLRLQMMMDRRSKFMAALSNIMKKMSDTSGSMVQNMK
jgi:hypothetical protein